MSLRFMAILLFKQEKIGIGKSRNLAGMHLIEFQHELAKRDICIHYDVEDFQEGIKTLREMGRL